ncbi:MAG: hypothetical protein IPM57_10760 [Oligoflexia bacterium]|nr:hypothetical protein [Oligoflexia bacterium]
MFLLSSIKKAIGVLAINENSLMNRKETNVIEFAIKSGCLVLRHVTYGNSQRLKLTITPANDDFTHADTCYYAVSLAAFTMLVNSACRIIGASKGVEFVFYEQEKNTNPIIKSGDYNLVIPCAKNKQDAIYDDAFNANDALFKTTMRFSPQALKTAAGADVRYYLTGVAFHLADLKGGNYSARLISTDGHRMTVFKEVLTKDDFSIAKDFNLKEPIIFTGNNYQVLTKAINNEPVNFSIKAVTGGNHLVLFNSKLDDITIDLAAKTIDGKYPDYGRVMGLDKPISFDIDLYKLEIMLSYLSAYFFCDGTEKYKTAVFYLSLANGTASIQATPNRFDTVYKGENKKTKSKATLIADDDFLSKLSKELSALTEDGFKQIANQAPVFSFDCDTTIESKTPYIFGLNTKYLSDVIAMFKKNNCKKVKLLCSLTGADINNTLSTTIQFKNYTGDEPVNSGDANIHAVIMPVRVTLSMY